MSDIRILYHCTKILLQVKFNEWPSIHGPTGPWWSYSLKGVNHLRGGLLSLPVVGVDTYIYVTSVNGGPVSSDFVSGDDSKSA